MNVLLLFLFVSAAVAVQPMRRVPSTMAPIVPSSASRHRFPAVLSDEEIDLWSDDCVACLNVEACVSKCQYAKDQCASLSGKAQKVCWFITGDPEETDTEGDTTQTDCNWDDKDSCMQTAASRCSDKCSDLTPKELVPSDQQEVESGSDAFVEAETEAHEQSEAHTGLAPQDIVVTDQASLNPVILPAAAGYAGGGPGQLLGVPIPAFSAMQKARCERKLSTIGAVQGFTCPGNTLPAVGGNNQDAQIAAFLNGIWGTAGVTRDLTVCRASALHSPRFNLDIYTSPVGFAGQAFKCIRTEFMAGHEDQEKCADAMQQRVCSCITQSPAGWVAFGLADYTSTAFDSHPEWRCTTHLPTDAELFNQASPCMSPLRHARGATLYASVGFGGCPILPRKYHPMVIDFPVPWVAPNPMLPIRTAFGRPMFKYTAAQLQGAGRASLAVAGRRVIFTDAAANPPLLWLGQVVLNGAGQGVYQNGAGVWVMALNPIAWSPTAEFARWRTPGAAAAPVAFPGVIAAVGAPRFEVPLNAMTDVYVMVEITCAALRHRFGRIQLGDCTPLYHATDSQNADPNIQGGANGFWENGPTYSPRLSGGASFFAMDWFYSASYSTVHHGKRLIEYAYRVRAGGAGKHLLNLGYYPNYDALAAVGVNMGTGETRDSNWRTELSLLVMGGKVKDLKLAYRDNLLGLINAAIPVAANHWTASPLHWYDQLAVATCSAAPAGDRFWGYAGTDYSKGREVSFFNDQPGVAANVNGGVQDMTVYQTFWLGKGECAGKKIVYPNAPAVARNGAVAGVVCELPQNYPQNPNWVRRWFKGAVKTLQPTVTQRWDPDHPCPGH